VFRRVTEREFAGFLQGAKIRAFRWDVTAWALVIDLDTFLGDERPDAELYRGWLLFEGLRSIEFPQGIAVLPNGFVVTDGAVHAGGATLAVVFTVDGGSMTTGALCVRADQTYAVCSAKTFKDDYPSSLEARVAAASDAMMLEAAFKIRREH